jgi:four helix bundle protein
MKEHYEVFNFEKLHVYQYSLDYIDLTYTLSQKFPSFEQYALGQQFRRAGHSIALNIGEGENGTAREFLSFLRISRRSVQECIVCTTVALRRNYITEEESMDSRRQLARLSKMISGLSQAVRQRSAQPGSSKPQNPSS